jgi:hypothetical protein
MAWSSGVWAKQVPDELRPVEDRHRCAEGEPGATEATSQGQAGERDQTDGDQARQQRDLPGLRPLGTGVAGAGPIDWGAFPQGDHRILLHRGG